MAGIFKSSPLTGILGQTHTEIWAAIEAQTRSVRLTSDSSKKKRAYRAILATFHLDNGFDITCSRLDSAHFELNFFNKTCSGVTFDADFIGANHFTQNLLEIVFLGCLSGFLLENKHCYKYKTSQTNTPHCLILHSGIIIIILFTNFIICSMAQ